MWNKLILIAVAGSVGTLTRYWVSGLAYRVFGESLAYGTLVVNVLGSLAFGFVWALSEDRMAISVLTRTVILTGFMGAFTTFSTFAFETVNYLRDGQYGFAFLNLTLQCVLGFGSVILGLWAGRTI